jgi:CrcB protein
MIKILLFIGLAGFAGTLIRYASVKFVDYLLPGFPWGTFVVNVTGAFLAGFCFVLCRCKFQQYEAYFPVLFLGFFGAFTPLDIPMSLLISPDKYNAII